MKNWMKYVALALVLCTLIAFAVACGEDDPATTTAATTAGDVTTTAGDVVTTVEEEDTEEEPEEELPELDEKKDPSVDEPQDW